jgi:hypothetical protein
MTPSGSFTASRPVILVTDDTADLLALEARANALSVQVEIVAQNALQTIKLNQAEVIVTHSTNDNGRSHKGQSNGTN